MASTAQTGGILLLGASGKLGRMAVRLWPEVVGTLSNLLPVYRSDSQGLSWAPGRPYDGLPTVDVVVALWGVTRGDADALAMNSTLALEAMDLAAALGARRVIHCSSAAVYAPKAVALDEATEPAPPAGYGRSKVDMERAIAKWCRANPDGPEAVCMRIGNVAGADSLFANMRPGGTLRLDRFDTGQGPARSYIAPSDLLRAINTLILADNPPQVVNVAAPVPTAMEALARAAECDVVWQDAPDTAVPLVWLDTTRLSVLYDIGQDRADAETLVRDARQTGVWP